MQFYLISLNLNFLICEIKKVRIRQNDFLEPFQFMQYSSSSNYPE